VISLARTTRLTESPSRRRCLASAWLGWSAAVGLLAALASATPLAADDAAEVEALERRLVDAIGSRDLETYSRLVADDYVATRPDGSELTKAQVMASYRSGERGYVDLAIEGVKGRVYGDTGVVTARTRGKRIEDGKEIENRVLYVRVFARREGRWQAVAQLSTPLP
jgi:ketosteroid isomerase-like protein